MRSPFGVFRKHGTILTAGLVVLCMFAFTLADFLQPQHLPAVLGVVAFALIFYLLGQPSGKGGWFAVAGAALGLAVVSLLPNVFKPAPAATTAVGNLSEEELRKKLDQRRAANQFVYQVYRAGAGPRPSAEDWFAQFPSLASNPQLLEMLMPSLMQQQANWDRGFQNFGFAPLEERIDSAREAVVREWVMAQEADKLGIRVSNSAITEYLQKASAGRLSREQFIEFRKDLNMSESQLYDMLRYHIKARQYLLLTFPTAMTPPEQQWDFYKRATVKQDMELAKLPVESFVDQVADPKESDLLAFYDAHKNRQPQGIITRDEGWTEPVELLTPEPAFGQPRRIKLAYLTARVAPYEPTEVEIAEFYEKNKEDYPNPAFSRPLEDDEIPAPVTPGGPAVAQKPKRESHAPAWAEKQEFLTLHQARDQVRGDVIFAAQQVDREKNDKLISQALAMMNDLSLDFQSEGEEHKTPQQISDELKAFAEKHGLEYTVPPAAWTPKEMTATRIGQAVEVEIKSSPLPGELRASVRTGGANVVYLVFRNTTPEELYRPNQVISRNEVDTRYVYWKIEDHPPQTLEWGDLGEDQRQAVRKAWKIQNAREIARKRAVALRDSLKAHLDKQPKDAEDKDLQLVLEELKETTVTGKKDGPELLVSPAYGVQWMQPPTQQTGPRLGTVFGAPKAGEKFMETAFHELENVGDVGVLVNADATEYYVGRLLGRQYGEGDSLDSLRESFINQTGTPALQTVNELVYQQNQELFQKWRQQFDEKFRIQVPQYEDME